MVGIKHESMRKGQTSHKKEHNTRMCFPLKPVFTRDKGGLPNFMDVYGGIVNRASLILSLKAMILQARELFSLRHPAAVVLARQTRV